MNKELIEALDMLNNIKYWDTCPQEYKDRIEALQKAKQQPTKNAEEFYKEWTSICRVYPKEITFCHTQEEMIQFAEEYSNQRKWISVEDKKQLLIDYSKWLQLNGYEPYSSDFAEAFLIENDIKPQPPVTNDKQ